MMMRIALYFTWVAAPLNNNISMRRFEMLVWGGMRKGSPSFRGEVLLNIDDCSIAQLTILLSFISLTVEFCPGREGPILFGDDENGYVMSYIFKLRDSQARGKTRHYAFTMLMTDRVFLVSCWPFLVKYVFMFIPGPLTPQTTLNSFLSFENCQFFFFSGCFDQQL